ncbi:MAG: lipopolysaccharide assembly protein LapA domain-containing protein [Alphaproteobacteria bacterium]
MKRFSWLLTVPLIVVAAIYSIANRELITLDLWPFKLQLPLFVALLACLVIGLVVGGLATWRSAAPTRRRARQARRQVAELEREVARLRQERDRATRAVTPPADSDQPGLPAPAAGAPEPEKRSVLSR